MSAFTVRLADATTSKSAADKAMSRQLSVAENLQAHPAMGRAGRIAGTRELVLSDPPYIIACRVTETRVELLAFIHTSRRWPAIL